jgi:hypothetical protein
MKPSKVSGYLRKIAARLDASSSPSRELVTRDIRSVISRIAMIGWVSETPAAEVIRAAKKLGYTVGVPDASGTGIPISGKHNTLFLYGTEESSIESNGIGEETLEMIERLGDEADIWFISEEEYMRNNSDVQDDSE